MDEHNERLDLDRSLPGWGKINPSSTTLHLSRASHHPSAEADADQRADKGELP